MFDEWDYRMCPGCGAMFARKASDKRGESYRNGVCYYCFTKLDNAEIKYLTYGTEIPDEIRNKYGESNIYKGVDDIKQEYLEKNIYPYPEKMGKRREFLRMAKMEDEESEHVVARQMARYNRNTNVHVPKCPTCGSTDVSKISGLERGASIVTLGIFSKKINKSFKCRSCGYVW